MNARTILQKRNYSMRRTIYPRTTTHSKRRKTIYPKKKKTPPNHRNSPHHHRKTIRLQMTRLRTSAVRKVGVKEASSEGEWHEVGACYASMKPEHILTLKDRRSFGTCAYEDAGLRNKAQEEHNFT